VRAFLTGPIVGFCPHPERIVNENDDLKEKPFFRWIKFYNN